MALTSIANAAFYHELKRKQCGWIESQDMYINSDPKMVSANKSIINSFTHTHLYHKVCWRLGINKGDLFIGFDCHCYERGKPLNGADGDVTGFEILLTGIGCPISLSIESNEQLCGLNGEVN